ncbi:MAG TPA: hypothetical protein VK196_10125 [Magnetospirillum sp.]|nr:hypothetical protein [Magnetospirillum sp.]
MYAIRMLAVVGLLLGCAPAAMVSDHPVEVVGPENHALVLDGLS